MITFFLTLFITTLSTTSAITIERNYTPLNVTDFFMDTSTSNLVSIGAYNMLDDLINQQGALPGANYIVDNVLSVNVRADIGLYYRFDTTFTSNVDIAFRATFTVYTEPWLGTASLVSYAYALPDNEITKNEKFVALGDGALPVNYFQVDPSQLKHDIDLSDALYTGISPVASYLVSIGKLPESSYSLAEVQSIYAQNVGGINFRFNVNITNCAGLKARIVFWSYSLLALKTLTVSSVISVDVVVIPEEGLIGGNCQTEQNGNSESENIINEEQEFNNEEGDLAGGYVPIDSNEFSNSPEIQHLFVSGALYVADQVIKARRIVDTQYYLNNFYYAESQEVSDGTKYRFYIDMTNCQNDVVMTTYTVLYQASTGNTEVTAYTFQVISFPTGVYAGGCLTPIEQNSEEEQVFSPVQEYTLVLANWASLNVSEISPAAQSIMNFGLQQSVEQAIESQNLPNQAYQQTELITAEIQAGKAVNYRFHAKLTGESGVMYDINYGIYFDPTINYQQLTFCIISRGKNPIEIVSQGSR